MRVALIFLLIIIIAGTASAQEPQGTVEITSPLEGQPLFGLVEITGTATHPSLFNGYALEWSNAQNPDVWLPIQSTINQQVINGILGQWDTVSTGVPDGIYQIRLRMFLSDNSVQDFEVKGLRVANSAPTELPTIPSTQAAAPTLPQVGGETPTPIILQPPTVTPRPTFEQPLIPADDTDTGEAEFVNFNAVQDAFCNGVFFSMILFGIIIIYLMLRSQISPFTRRLWWQIRSELEDNQKDY